MADITAAMVKELRDSTGAGMMDAKKALVENNGDMEASVDWLARKACRKRPRNQDGRRLRASLRLPNPAPARWFLKLTPKPISSPGTRSSRPLFAKRLNLL